MEIKEVNKEIEKDMDSSINKEVKEQEYEDNEEEDEEDEEEEEDENDDDYEAKDANNNEINKGKENIQKLNNDNSHKQKRKKRRSKNITTSLIDLNIKNIFNDLEKQNYINNAKMSLSHLIHIIAYPAISNLHQITSKPPECYSINFSKCSKITTSYHQCFAMGYSNGEIDIINNLTNRIQVKTYHDPISSLRYHPTKPSTLLAITSIGDVIHLHSLSGRTLSKFNIPFNALRALDYDSKGDNFAIGASSGEVYIYNEHMQMLEHTFHTGTSFAKGHVDQVHSVVFPLNEPNAIISGGRDKRIVLWDKRSDSAAAMMIGPMIMGDAVDVKKNMLLTGSYDIREGVQIWDLRMRKVVKEYKVNSMIYCCKFNHSELSNTNLFAVCGYKKNDVKVFNIAKGMDYVSGVNAFTFPIYALDFSMDGKNFIYACEDGGARLVEL